MKNLGMTDKAAVGTATMGAILIGVIILVVGLSLTTTVVSFVNSSFAALTGNTAAQNLVNILPVFYILGLLGVSIGVVFVALRHDG